MATLFSDFNKKTKDLLTKEYTTDHKLKVEAKDGKNKFTANLSRPSSGGAVKGDISGKFSICPHTGATATVTSKTAGNVSAELEFTKIPGVAGLSATLEAACDPSAAKDGQKCSFTSCSGGKMTATATYAAPSGLFKSKAKASCDGAYEAQVAFSATHGITLGAMAAGKRGGSTNLDVGVLMAKDASQVAIVTKKGLQGVTASVNKSIGSGKAIAFQADYAKGGSVEMAVGAAKTDGGKFVKGKVTSAGVASVAYGWEPSQGLKAVASAQVDFLQAGKDVHKFGLGFTFTD